MSTSFLAACVTRAADTTPTFRITSSNHRKWMLHTLEVAGWRAAACAGATFYWELSKKLIPRPMGARAFNGLPNLLLLDDKAYLALICRRFVRTRPLVTHVLYGEWDDARIDRLRGQWADPACAEPRWWIIKDAHASNGFSASLFDREARELQKKDVGGGYCYVVQEYVERPLLIRGRKFELRQYVLVRGDGSAYTYERALIRLACVPYALDSTDRRAHITNKWVQLGGVEGDGTLRGEAVDELVELEAVELVSSRWPEYAALFEAGIVPLVADLADAVAPLLAAGIRSHQRGGGGGSGWSDGGSIEGHFELFACDLVVSEAGRVALMEVNINCAFGAFAEATQRELIQPLFDDLLALCVLPVASGKSPPRPGAFRQVRLAGFDADKEAGSVAGPAGTAEAAEALSKDLQAHIAYVTFKKRCARCRMRWVRRAGGVSDAAPRSSGTRELAALPPLPRDTKPRPTVSQPPQEVRTQGRRGAAPLHELRRSRAGGARSRRKAAGRQPSVTSSRLDAARWSPRQSAFRRVVLKEILTGICPDCGVGAAESSAPQHARQSVACTLHLPPRSALCLSPPRLTSGRAAARAR